MVVKKQPLRTRKLAGKEVIPVATSLEKILFPAPSKVQNSRAQYGRQLDLDRIDRAIRAASGGNMVDISDLGAETLMLDGHLTGVVQKRLNRAAAIGWQIVANDGSGVQDFDHGRAKVYADFVRHQLLRIPNFRGSLIDISWGTWNNRALSEIGWEIGTGASVGDSKLATGWRARELFWVHPRRLSFNQQRKLVVLDDAVGQGAPFDPRGFDISTIPEKFIPNQPRLFNDYQEREGLLVRCLYWSFFQRLGTRERLQLMEIFGAPWRIAYSDGDTPVNTESLRDAAAALEEMNTRQVAFLPPGIKPNIFQPGAGSGQVHKEAIDDARYVISKLTLGVTGTTDAVSTGLGSSIGDAHLSEEDMIIAGDLMQRADVIEHRLVDVIIELNYGPEALAYSPKFQFDLKGVVDRTKSAALVMQALDAGLQVPLEEAYEKFGLRMPRTGEPYLAKVQPQSEGGMPSEQRNRIVYPVGTAIPAPGTLALEPEEDLGLDESGAPIPQAIRPDAPTPPARPAPVPEEQPVPEAAREQPVTPTHPFPSPSGLTDADRE